MAQEGFAAQLPLTLSVMPSLEVTRVTPKSAPNIPRLPFFLPEINNEKPRLQKEAHQQISAHVQYPRPNKEIICLYISG